MQMRNSLRVDPVGNENFPDWADFPTEEELLTALEISLEQSPWLPRSNATALDATSRALARHWQELDMNHSGQPQEDGDDHYLAPWVKEPALPEELPVEADFMADFARFLSNRLLARLRETHQAQNQLRDELAKLRP